MIDYQLKKCLLAKTQNPNKSLAAPEYGLYTPKLIDLGYQFLTL